MSPATNEQRSFRPSLTIRSVVVAHWNSLRMNRNSGFFIESAVSVSCSMASGTTSSHSLARAPSSLIHKGTVPASSASTSPAAALSKMALSSCMALPVSTSWSFIRFWHISLDLAANKKSSARGGSPTIAGLLTTSSSTSRTHALRSSYWVCSGISTMGSSCCGVSLNSSCLIQFSSSLRLILIFPNTMYFCWYTIFTSSPSTCTIRANISFSIFSSSITGRTKPSRPTASSTRGSSVGTTKEDNENSSLNASVLNRYSMKPSSRAVSYLLSTRPPYTYCTNIL